MGLAGGTKLSAQGGNLGLAGGTKLSALGSGPTRALALGRKGNGGDEEVDISEGPRSQDSMRWNDLLDSFDDSI